MNPDETLIDIEAIVKGLPEIIAHAPLDIVDEALTIIEAKMPAIRSGTATDVLARCDFCLCQAADTCLIQVRVGKEPWQPAQPTCAPCRDYLRGYWRYAEGATT